MKFYNLQIRNSKAVLIVRCKTIELLSGPVSSFQGLHERLTLKKKVLVISIMVVALVIAVVVCGDLPPDTAVG